MENFYTVDIKGRKEDLPILPLPSGTKIAFFNLHGNQDLTEYCGKEIAKMLKGKNIDVVLTAESKGLQLSHVVARELKMPFYAVARKTKKLYTQDGISIDYGASITTGKPQQLYLSKHDVDLIHNKNVAIVDDVVSTGESLRALEALCKVAEANVTARAFVLAEGDAAKRKDVLYLGILPLL